MSTAPILVILGPTASGKSGLAIKLARRFNGEIVSADSRQIYQGMNIGTGKVPLIAKGKSQSAGGIAHHLIDIKNPSQDYTVVEYKRDAIKTIRDIIRRKKLPILVGGTGLYIKAIVENLDIPKTKANPALRKKLDERIKNKGLGSLVEELLRRDPEAANIVDLKNPRRVVRALEVAIQTGRPFTAQRQKGPPLFEAFQIGIKLSPKKMRARINHRVDEMIRGGLVDEVKKLYGKYGDVKALDAIGYREIINYLTANGLGTNQPNRHKSALPKEVVEQIKLNTWHYAHRQLTWFRKDKRIKWAEDPRTAIKFTKRFIEEKSPGR